jgi:hypothetical protein
MDYGVIGFNGATKISASTTHLYVFVSYFFNLIFGKENFIEPLLIFNTVLFTIGSFSFSSAFKNPWHKAILYFFGILPPSIKDFHFGNGVWNPVLFRNGFAVLWL